MKCVYCNKVIWPWQSKADILTTTKLKQVGFNVGPVERINAHYSCFMDIIDKELHQDIQETKTRIERLTDAHIRFFRWLENDKP